MWRLWAAQGGLGSVGAELAAQTGRRVIPLVADVTSKEQVDSMVAQAAQQLGGLHILVTAVPRQGLGHRYRPH